MLLADDGEVSGEGGGCVAEPTVITLSFDRPGSLGIEFERLSAPFVVEQIHASGLANGCGLEPGDRLVDVGGESVDHLAWEDFVSRLQRRPVGMTFLRDQAEAARRREAAGGPALLSSLAGMSMGTIGARVNDLGGKVLAGGLGNKVAGGLGGALGGAGRLAGGALGGLGGALGAATAPAMAAPELGEADEATEAEAARQAEEMRKQAEDKAARQAEEMRKQAEDEAARLAEEARKRAEDEAARQAEAMRKRAEDEAARQAEAMRKRAEDEAARQAEENRKRAEDEAARRAESEAKARAEAEEEAARQAEDEKRKRAEEEAVAAREVEAQAKARQEAEEKQRVAELEAMAKAQAEEEEARRKEAEEKRKQAEEDAAREAELEAKIREEACEARAKAQAEEEEARRKEAEEVRKQAEEDAARAADLEAKMKEEADEERRRAESEAKAKEEAAEEETRRLEAEQQRKQAHERAAREAELEAKAREEADERERQAVLKAKAQAEADEDARIRAEAQKKLADDDSRQRLAKKEAEVEARMRDVEMREQELEKKWQHELAAKNQEVEAARQSEVAATGRAQELEAKHREVLEAKSKAEAEAHQLREVARTADERLKALREEQAAQAEEVRRTLEAEAKQAEQQAQMQKPTFYEVMFALQGSLGLEFQRLEPPYIVEQVHEKGVANGLGIERGDELVQVAEHDVSRAAWAQLVERLTPRPVAARFCRDPSRLQHQGQDGFISSVGSLLTAARTAVPLAARGAPASVEERSGGLEDRMQSEIERLNTLLKTRGEEIDELLGRLAQREEALRVFEGSAGAPDAAQAARHAEERIALTQQIERLRAKAETAESCVQTLRAERDAAVQRCSEEAREKEEHRGQAAALAERCGSLMTQFESLRATCENLSLDAQEKAGLESQVQQLMKVNVQWQQAHDDLNNESQGLRHQAGELQQLRAEVGQLRRYEAACGVLEQKLREADARHEAQLAAAQAADDERGSAQNTIQRLQALVEALQDTGESRAGQLESELLERSRETAALRRDVEELRRANADHVRRQQETEAAAQDGRTLRGEVESLRAALAAGEDEKRNLTAVIDRCMEKLEKDGRERPHLVDKRMVTQMVAAFLENRDRPRQALDIMAKMADLLGFTSAEREQVGLSQQRRSLVRQAEDPASLAELSDRFMDFLLEEAET